VVKKKGRKGRRRWKGKGGKGKLDRRKGRDRIRPP